MATASSSLGGKSAKSLPSDVDPSPFVVHNADGTASLILLVGGIHCGSCVQRIERALAQKPGIISARINMTTKRLSARWFEQLTSAEAIVSTLADLGYPATPFSIEPAHGDRESRGLLRALAVAGFASTNVMLLSVAIWAGAFGDMGPATRNLLQWISALIVMPAVAYSIRPFLNSALAGLKRGEMRMDLPISLAVLLTLGMSLFETMRNGTDVYFDAAASLLFLLLVGRVLDRQARTRAFAAAENLLVLRGTTATIIDPDGQMRAVRVESLDPGMTVLVAAGAGVPADGVILTGQSDIDTSLVTGETVPQAVKPGARVFAGTLNRTGPLTMTVSAAGEGTLLSEIVRLMEAAGQSRARMVRLADAAARIYAPVVHLAALATFILWWGILGHAWQQSLLVAVSVLIITCPCALGLAVPVVQVVASGRLMRRGILLKAPDGLERLATIDTVVFDKTGTLSLGRLTLANTTMLSKEALALAASMAATSRHPLCQALLSAADSVVPAVNVREHPGEGLSLEADGAEIRLGNSAWCGQAADQYIDDEATGPELWLTRPGHAAVRFMFRDQLRPDAAATIAFLKNQGLAVELLSGDRKTVVGDIAQAVGIDNWLAHCHPADKTARLSKLAEHGHKVLMVGDGLNDAPALAAAHVSMSPATAADLSQASADIVFQGDRLDAVVEAWQVAKKARRLMMQNFAFTALYNGIAVPFAVIGLVTPLIAAIAMSASSLAVIGNALRLSRASRRTA
jgi:P-type Cu2+ transporter